MNQDENVLGTDLSTWNFRQGEVIDADRYDDGLSFAIVKATDGGSLVDADFSNTVDGLNSEDIPLGMYHYFRFHTLAYTIQQAKHFADVVRSKGIGKLGVWGDFEDGSANNHILSTKQNWVRVWCEEVEDSLGVPVGIYTNSWWDTHIGISNIPVGRSLWTANWHVTKPYVPKDWRIKFGTECWTFWQYTNRLDCRPFGVPDSTVDGNWFNGTYNGFNQMFGVDISRPGTDPEPDPQPEPDVSMVQIVGLKGGARLNLRQKPWGTVKAQTWNGMIFPVINLIGYDENPQKYWLQICGAPENENAKENLVVASWYTRAIA